MTLIVAMATRDFILLASDRRVTRTETVAPGRTVTLSQDDTDTKTIVLNGRYILGFAGLARIPQPGIDSLTGAPNRQRMEAWLCAVLSGVSPDDYWSTIADRFGTVVEEANFRRQHRFMAVGWAEQETGSMRSEMIDVRNSVSAVHTLRPYRHLCDEPYELSCAGFDPPAAALEQLRGFIDRNVEQYCSQPAAFVNPIRRLYRAAAAISGGTVGESILMTSLPRACSPWNDGAAIDLTEPDPETYRKRLVSRFHPPLGEALPVVRYFPAIIGPEFCLMGGLESDTREALGPTEGYGV